MPTRFQLRGETLEGLEWKVFNDYPSGSRIVAAEKVTEGGIAGFLARHFFEITVEIPDTPAPRQATGTQESGAQQPDTRRGRRSAAHRIPDRAGVAALLREADDAEAAMHEVSRPKVSTESGDFAAVLDSLTSTTRQDPAPAGAVPVPLGAAGDAVMVVGIGADALATARSMADARGSAAVCTAGSYRVPGVEHLVSRTGLTAARAAGVLSGEPVFVAFGLAADGGLQASALTDLQADQVWLAVDATRKPTDTVIWVRKVGWAARADALAVLGSQNTLTPQSVNDLDLPIGWVDGRPATRPAL
ncbi:hypothetical protein KIH31_09380 [Paenarthrobacter sp. DKR-5]|uniref:hypothetical protein n=1 Tax=Paenarthrobacter sp. DKR-5 TaxID=2835535 RepID=UPI001BDD6912|nr:hypothetical protein [Paenarthrobacter sp. DKR-5]MBT1002816.1 hypothetical protein [Paenarthrobacter sp. DKR-5]